MCGAGLLADLVLRLLMAYTLAVVWRADMWSAQPCSGVKAVVRNYVTALLRHHASRQICAADSQYDSSGCYSGSVQPAEP
jgi:hypothetical protein